MREEERIEGVREENKKRRPGLKAKSQGGHV